MSRRSESTVLTANVPQALADKVDQLAKQQERSRGWIIKLALTAWVEQEDEYDRLTREGLADVDAGRTVSHESVESWIASIKSGS